MFENAPTQVKEQIENAQTLATHLKGANITDEWGVIELLQKCGLRLVPDEGHVTHETYNYGIKEGLFTRTGG